MRIAGVVVLYNPDEKVCGNIKSYIQDIETLFVVDNSDVDNSGLFSGEKIKYIANRKNLGIAAALNIGAKCALEEGFEWLLTMDQDSRFGDGQVIKMIDFLERMQTDTMLQNIINIPYDKIGLITPFHRTKFNEAEEHKGIDSPLTVMTSGNLISLNAYKKIGGFKDWFFIDAVDFDYCLNLRVNKYDILRLNFVELKHELGDVVFKKILHKKMYSLNHNPLRRYYIVRNRHYFCEMYKKEFPEYCKLEKSRTKREMIKILFCEKQKFKKIMNMIQGYFDYKRGIKGEKTKNT